MYQNKYYMDTFVTDCSILVDIFDFAFSRVYAIITPVVGFCSFKSLCNDHCVICFDTNIPKGIMINDFWNSHNGFLC